MVLGRGLLLALGLSATGIATALPSIVTCSGYGLLTLWRFSPRDRDYHEVTARTIPGALRVTSLNGRVVVGTSDSLFVLDTLFTTRLAASPVGAASLGVIDGLICYSARGLFVVCDTLLRVQDSVPLKHKSADDIICIGRRAYLMDDILYPLYLFCVELDSQGRLSLQRSIEFSCVNGHLVNQWVDTCSRTWAALEDWKHMGGSGQTLHLFKLDSNGLPSKSARPYAEHTVWATRSAIGGLTTAIVATTGVGQPWVLLREHDSLGGRVKLCRVSVGTGGIRYDNASRLPRARTDRLYGEVYQMVGMRVAGTIRIRDWQNKLVTVTPPVPETARQDGRAFVRQSLLVYDVQRAPTLLVQKDIAFEYDAVPIVDYAIVESRCNGGSLR